MSCLSEYARKKNGQARVKASEGKKVTNNFVWISSRFVCIIWISHEWKHGNLGRNKKYAQHAGWPDGPLFFCVFMYLCICKAGLNESMLWKKKSNEQDAGWRTDPWVLQRKSVAVDLFAFFGIVLGGPEWKHGKGKKLRTRRGWPDGPLGPPTEVSCCRLGGGADGRGSSYEKQVTSGSVLFSVMVKYVAVTFSKDCIIME